MISNTVNTDAVHSPVAELHRVSKNFGSVQALHKVSINIEAGEVLGLFGHNGAGKSTLMKILLGILTPSSGRVTTLGHCPTATGSHHYRRQFGYLPENVSFYQQLTGREVLLYFARLKGYSKTQAEPLLDKVGLKQAANRSVKTYSKGMRQRLGLAQALLGEPKLLLLDEPTVGLDPVATSDFYTSVDQLKSRGCAVILCSHVLAGVEAHIDRALILGSGRQLALGNLQTLRKAAALPIEIRTRGLSLERLTAENPVSLAQCSLAQFSLAQYICKKSANGTQQLLVPQADKISVIRHLLQQQALQDIELHEPSLEALYRHFITQKQRRQQHKQQDGADG